MFRLLIFLVTLSVRALRAFFLSRSELLAENLALRQQICALKRERPRPLLDDVDRAFWVALRASWPGWASRLPGKGVTLQPLPYPAPTGMTISLVSIQRLPRVSPPLILGQAP